MRSSNVKSRGCGVVYLMQCYPRPALEHELQELEAMPPPYPVLFVLTGRTFGWTDEALAESHRLVNAAIERGVGMGVLHFGVV